MDRCPPSLASWPSVTEHLLNTLKQTICAVVSKIQWWKTFALPDDTAFLGFSKKPVVVAHNYKRVNSSKKQHYNKHSFHSSAFHIVDVTYQKNNLQQNDKTETLLDTDWNNSFLPARNTWRELHLLTRSLDKWEICSNIANWLGFGSSKAP